jgi:glucose-6-phosphate-specific signal transduction histidine kinase
MIPIVAINFAVIAVLSFVISARLHRTRNASQVRTPLLDEFSSFYKIFGAAFFIWALPGIILSNENYFEYFYLVGYFLLYIAIAYMGYIALSLIERDALARKLFNGAVVLGIFLSCARFLTEEIPVTEISNNLIFWQPQYPQLLRTATGLISSLLAFSSAIIFIMQGYKHTKNKLIFHRSMWLAFGMFLLGVASISSFMAGGRASLSSSLTGTLVAIAALLSILKGILYKNTA